jgi:hypothetical protein
LQVSGGICQIKQAVVFTVELQVHQHYDNIRKLFVTCRADIPMPRR